MHGDVALSCFDFASIMRDYELNISPDVDASRADAYAHFASRDRRRAARPRDDADESLRLARKGLRPVLIRLYR